jgi:hypothetical protein
MTESDFFDENENLDSKTSKKQLTRKLPVTVGIGSTPMGNLVSLALRKKKVMHELKRPKLKPF